MAKLPRPDWVERRFPTKKARDAADAVIDRLPETEPMTKYIDVWLAAYRANGGIERSSK
jgi:hypothetical protein